MRGRCLQHVAIAVGQDDQLVAGETEAMQSGDHVGKRLQRLDSRDQGADFILACS